MSQFFDPRVLRRRLEALVDEGIAEAVGVSGNRVVLFVRDPSRLPQWVVRLVRMGLVEVRRSGRIVMY